MALTWLRRATTIDDRGFDRPLVPKPDPRTPDRHRWAFRTAQLVRADSGASALVMVVAIFATMPLVSSLRGWAPNANPWLVKAIVWGAMWPIILVTMTWAQRRVRGTWRDRDANAICLAHGVCPACAYDLRSLTPETDGCVTCPECGAAWRATRITSPYSPDERPPGSPAEIARMSRPGWRVLPVRITDARGSRTRAVPVRRWQKQRPDYEPAFAQATDQSCVAPTPTWRRAAWTLMIIGVVVFVLTMHWNFTTRSVNWDMWFRLLIVLVIALFAASLALWKIKAPPRVLADRITRAFLHWRLCPACGTDLIACPPDSDGATVCPNCDSAWAVADPALALPMRCTRCGYDLSSQAPHASGHVACPECAAAVWIARDRRSERGPS